MSARLATVFSLLLLVPAFASFAYAQQQSNIQQRVYQRFERHDNHMRPESAPGVDENASRKVMLTQDVQEWSALSSSLQSDFQQLQKGMLVKDLAKKLKQMEKLSKRLRQEVSQ